MEILFTICVGAYGWTRLDTLLVWVTIVLKKSPPILVSFGTSNWVEMFDCRMADAVALDVGSLSHH